MSCTVSCFSMGRVQALSSVFCGISMCGFLGVVFRCYITVYWNEITVWCGYSSHSLPV
jgi:hypothetical protein